MPHRSLNEILHPNDDNMPLRLRWYAAAIHHFPDLWNNTDNLKSHLTFQGHRDTYITTIMSYVDSLSNLFYLWQMQIVTAAQLHEIETVHSEQGPPLDPQQTAVKQHIYTAITNRLNYYNYHNVYDSLNECDSNDEVSDSNDEAQYAFHEHDVENLSIAQVQWQKPILVTGKPGSGKSHTLLATMAELREKDVTILIASPTGFLASIFRAKVHDHVTCDTVHAAFRIPVNPEQRPTTNWSLSAFDVVVIDEISMIPQQLFEHVLNTINRLIVRPVLVLCGDNAQQQPFGRTDGYIVSVPSPLSNNNFTRSTYHFNLTSQHRIGDPRYLNFLDHIRHWIPQQHVLDEIQEGRIICKDENINEQHITEIFQKNPNTTILTFTNSAANTLNKLAVKTIFRNIDPLATVHLDDDVPPTNLFKDMRVMITQNRDKKNNVVNGQIATIHTIQNSTVILKLPNTSLVTVYPVTMSRNGRQRSFFPLRVGYANTMCKAQGQTLQKAVIWFDIDKIPAGTGYVAMSRVKRLEDISFMTALKPCFFTPVHLVNN